MDASANVNDDQQARRATNRRRGGYQSDSDGGSGGSGGNSKSSLGRKVASDAINGSTGSTMGASVYIADTISNTINFNF